MDSSKKKDTVGKISSELLNKTPESQDPIELERAMQEDYMKELLDTIDKGIKEYSHDFYITVITKNEKLMPNVFRNYFFHRKSCPTPEYDQSVYRYNRPLERVEYLWTVPSKEACIHLKKNALQVVSEEKGLLNFVLQFYDGTLLRLSKKFNNEKDNSPILEN